MFNALPALTARQALSDGNYTVDLILYLSRFALTKQWVNSGLHPLNRMQPYGYMFEFAFTLRILFARLASSLRRRLGLVQVLPLFPLSSLETRSIHEVVTPR
jgi:hypothetical protein